MRKLEIFDFDINCINRTDYELVVTFHTNNKVIKTLFRKAAVALKQKEGIEVLEDPKGIQQFEVIKRYLPLLNIYMRKPMGILKNKEFKPDGIEILTHDVKKAIFRRTGETWDIDIYVQGEYIDKRQ